MEKSNIFLQSNIVLKSLYGQSPKDYIPYDLLPDEEKDVRMMMHITQKQRQQQEKATLYAEKIIIEK